MTRRTALSLMAAPAIVPARRKIAITMDDVAWKSIPEPYAATADARLLDALHGHQAALFAAGRNIDNETGKQILTRWRAAGHVIGNHSYRHQPVRATTDDFEQDILKNAALLPPNTTLFRFPLLKEGNTREIRDELRRFLREYQYRNGAVTIDASDWYYSQRLVDRLKAEPKFDVNRYRDPYLAHLWDRARYYDELSQAALQRSVSHTILIHYNLINALFLADVIRMFRTRGWAVTSAEEAFADPIFQREPDTIPAGESLIWAIAKESGKFPTQLRYPGEDDVYEKPKLDRLKL
jgi:peptidoglycan/xylan/chitin deacetylase (PgdA/CDA1 family)